MIKKTIFFLLAILLNFSSAALSADQKIKENTLVPGNYYLNSKYKFEENGEIYEKSDLVILSREGNKILLINENQSEFPIIGTIINNSFSATLEDANGTVEFNAEINSENKLAGNMTGKNKMGKNKLSGRFELVPVNKK